MLAFLLTVLFVHLGDHSCNWTFNQCLWSVSVLGKRSTHSVLDCPLLCRGHLQLFWRALVGVVAILFGHHVDSINRCTATA
jgi:hypothetical protein